jgi:hypothetical protein
MLLSKKIMIDLSIRNSEDEEVKPGVFNSAFSKRNRYVWVFGLNEGMNIYENL